MRRNGLFLFTLLFALSLLSMPAPAQAQGDGWILFSSTRFGINNIFVMRPDGSSQTRLTNTSASDTEAVWSPDGNRIAFTSRRDGNPEIYVMNADGSNQTRLTFNDVSDYGPSWGADGRIAFTSRRDGNEEIYVMNADGTNQTRLTSGGGNSRTPAWSPDGQLLVYHEQSSTVGALEIMRADGSERRTLATGAFLNTPSMPRWSPDGTQIVFTRGSFDVNSQIMIINVDGSNERALRLEGNERVSIYFPVWSPDGSRLALNARHPEFDREVVVTNLNGTRYSLIPGIPGNDTLSDWGWGPRGATPQPQPQPQPQPGDQRCFQETGECISGRIREYWEQNGAEVVFGFPIAPQGNETIEGRTVQAQWFQRNRLELHPQNARPYDVLIGRVGADALAQRGYDWQSKPRETAQANCLFFSETNFNVCGRFAEVYRANGLNLDGQRGFSFEESKALFGLPLTGLITERLSDGREYQVQYFERARFEWHPENAQPYDVLFGLLGNELKQGSLPPGNV